MERTARPQDITPVITRRENVVLNLDKLTADLAADRRRLFGSEVKPVDQKSVTPRIK